MTHVHFRGLSFVVSTFALRWILLAGFLVGSVFAEDASLVELRKKAEAKAAADFDDAWLSVLTDEAVKGDAAAFVKLRKKAEAGDALAQHYIGLLYKNGDYVLKDTAEAIKWFRKSAEQGNAYAQLNLGLYYANGDGVLKDSVQAAAWLNNAGANGDELARSWLSEIEKTMTPEQKAEALKLAREIFNRVHKKQS